MFDKMLGDKKLSKYNTKCMVQYHMYGDVVLQLTLLHNFIWQSLNLAWFCAGSNPALGTDEDLQ